MGHRPVPTAPVYFFDEKPGNREQTSGPAYLYENIDAFMDRMRGQYDDWNEFEEWMENREISNDIHGS